MGDAAGASPCSSPVRGTTDRVAGWSACCSTTTEGACAGVGGCAVTGAVLPGSDAASAASSAGTQEETGGCGAIEGSGPVEGPLTIADALAAECVTAGARRGAGRCAAVGAAAVIGLRGRARGAGRARGCSRCPTDTVLPLRACVAAARYFWKRPAKPWNSRSSFLISASVAWRFNGPTAAIKARRLAPRNSFWDKSSS